MRLPWQNCDDAEHLMLRHRFSQQPDQPVVLPAAMLAQAADQEVQEGSCQGVGGQNLWIG